MRLFLRAAVPGAALLVLSAAAAAAQTSVATAGLWEFVTPYLLALVSAAATAILGWLAAALKAKWGIEIDAAHAKAIQDAATNAAGLLLRQAGGVLPERLDLKSPLVAGAVAYVAGAVPAAVAHFGLTPEALAARVLAKLPQFSPPAAADA